jgi:hypothetical protein
MLRYRCRETGPDTEALGSINRNQWCRRGIFLKDRCLGENRSTRGRVMNKSGKII